MWRLEIFSPLEMSTMWMLLAAFLLLGQAFGHAHGHCCENDLPELSVSGKGLVLIDTNWTEMQVRY